MAIITDYATLCTAVSDYLARSDLSTFVPNFVQTAEAKLYRMPLRPMEAALSGTIASGVLAVPSDYRTLKYANVSTTPLVSLERVSPEVIYKAYPTRSGAEIPRVIAREVDNFIFGPYPGNYTITGVYYKKLTRLSSTNTTNDFIEDAPDVLLYGALLEAQVFLQKDARIPVWQQFFNESLQTVQNESKRENTSGSKLQVRTA